jgi:hypothetical protein
MDNNLNSLQEFTTWTDSLDNVDKTKVFEFLDLLRISHQSSLVVGFEVDITPKNEIVFKTTNLSYGSLKKLTLAGK